MSQIYSYLRDHQDDMLQQVERLVRQDSPSNKKMLVDTCGRMVSELFRTMLKIEPDLITQEKVGNHLLAKVGTGQRKVLILGHFDTVWDPGVLEYRTEGNKAYGPGIFDMKAGIVQGIWALQSIQSIQGSLNAEVTFLLTSDEEIGSLTSRPLIEEQARNVDVVFVLEPSVGKTGAIKTARKGTFLYRIEAYGISAHAGNHPEDGASAVHELCKQVTEIVEFQNRYCGTTINVGTILGGTRPNVVAERASVEVDVRVSEQSEVQCVETFFHELKPFDNRVKLSVEGGLNRSPMVKSNQVKRLYDLAKGIGAEQLRIDLREESVGGGSDGNFTSALGVPTLDGLGAIGDGPHAEHEHILIDGLSQRAALLAHLLIALSEQNM